MEKVFPESVAYLLFYFGMVTFFFPENRLSFFSLPLTLHPWQWVTRLGGWGKMRKWLPGDTSISAVLCQRRQSCPTRPWGKPSMRGCLVPLPARRWHWCHPCRSWALPMPRTVQASVQKCSPKSWEETLLSCCKVLPARSAENTQYHARGQNANVYRVRPRYHRAGTEKRIWSWEELNWHLQTCAQSSTRHFCLDVWETSRNQ